jgi:DnaJ-class molecular chaperone
VLGVGRAATAGELRRAFRVLALRHHPDRAGPESTTTFQSIAEAYAVLSEPIARASYDARLRARESSYAPARADTVAARQGPAHSDGMEEGEYQGPGGRIGWRRRAARAAARIIDRLSGALEDLLARGVVRRAPDGVVELHLQPDEIEVGGTAAIDTLVTIACPTCSGLAERNVLWCRRCEYAGTVMETVTIAVEIPAQVSDRTTFTFATDPTGAHPPLRVRVRAA